MGKLITGKSFLGQKSSWTKISLDICPLGPRSPWRTVPWKNVAKRAEQGKRCVNIFSQCLKFSVDVWNIERFCNKIPLLVGFSSPLLYVLYLPAIFWYFHMNFCLLVINSLLIAEWEPPWYLRGGPKSPNFKTSSSS